jgi:hypothetical protein
MRNKKLVLLTLFVLGSLLATALPLSAQLRDSARVLVWAAPAPVPYQQTTDQSGELAYMNADGSLETIQAIPSNANRIGLCSARAVSPNGDHVALFIGNDDSPQGGGLFMMSEGGLPTQVATTQAVSCYGGNGRFTWSPDSERFGFLSYAENFRTRTFPSGDVKIHATDGFGEIFSTNTGDVTAFDMNNEVAIFVDFLPNANDEPVEATFNVWDGERSRELTLFAAKEGCRYNTAYAKIGAGAYWVILGERCGGGTEWQLHQIEEDGASVVALTQDPPGGLFVGSETSNLWFYGDEALLFTLPSGLGQNTAFFYRAPLSDLRAADDLNDDQHAQMFFLGRGENAAPVFSPDGQWLALTAKTGNASYVQLLNLEDPAGEFFTLEVAGLNEAVPFMQFTPDNELIYVAGGIALQARNAIYRLPEGGGEPEVIVRGNFSPWALVSPDGNRMLAMEWKEAPEAFVGMPDYLDLMVVNLEENFSDLLFEGFSVDEDGAASNSFILPIYWIEN